MYPRDLRRALLNEIRSDQTRGQAHGMTPAERLTAVDEMLALASDVVRAAPRRSIEAWFRKRMARAAAGT